jgi:hypothetical protein
MLYTHMHQDCQQPKEEFRRALEELQPWLLLPKGKHFSGSQHEVLPHQNYTMTSSLPPHRNVSLWPALTQSHSRKRIHSSNLASGKLPSPSSVPYPKTGQHRCSLITSFLYEKMWLVSLLHKQAPLLFAYAKALCIYWLCLREFLTLSICDKQSMNQR